MKDSRNTVIYALYSTEDNKDRYVGQTVQKIERRISQHLHEALKRDKKTRVANWIRKAISSGYEIKFRILQANAVYNESEKEWIKKLRENGTDLVNLTDGGEGTLGWHGNKGNKRPDLTLRNMQNRGKPGHKISDESKLKISDANKGKNKPWLAEINKKNKGKPGRPHTDESRAAISRALKGREITWGDKISRSKRNSNEKACV